jgi:hypothetical protein
LQESRLEMGIFGQVLVFSLFTFNFLLFPFEFSLLKASPPHVAGGVFFLGGGYDYIKGGEMERLIRVCIFALLAGGFLCRFALFFTAGFLFIVGDVPAVALELERAQGDDLLGLAPAMDALADGVSGDGLQGFKGFSAFQAPVLVDGHAASSE